MIKTPLRAFMDDITELSKVGIETKRVGTGEVRSVDLLVKMTHIPRTILRLKDVAMLT